MDQYEIDNLSHWKKNRRSNQFNTLWLLFNYFLSCALLGFIADVILSNLTGTMSLRTAIKSLALFDRTFYIMDTMIIFCILSLILLYVYQGRIFRLGLKTRQLSIDTAHRESEKALVEEFGQMSHMLGLRHVPTLWVAEHNFVNAFSSGYNEKTSLVVLTKGLIEQFDLAEVKAVLAVMLFRIKLRDTHLTQVVSFINSTPFLLFDTLFYKEIYDKNSKEKSVFLLNCIYFCLISIRFILPIMTFSFFSRFYLDPNRIYYYHRKATNFLGDNQSLTSALIKIRDAHLENATLVSREYSKIIHDGIRREAYFFDPTDFNLAQTFTSSFTTQPSIEDQLANIRFGINRDLSLIAEANPN